jgi:peptide/nickel transport system permease protein
MAPTFLRQLGGALLTLLAISVVTFCATSVRSPLDVARLANPGVEVTEEQLEAFVEKYDLDRPLPQRYLSWMGNVVVGDLGISPVTQRSVRDELVPRLTRTV